MEPSFTSIFKLDRLNVFSNFLPGHLSVKRATCVCALVRTPLSNLIHTHTYRLIYLRAAEALLG